MRACRPRNAGYRKWVIIGKEAVRERFELDERGRIVRTSIPICTPIPIETDDRPPQITCPKTPATLPIPPKLREKLLKTGQDLTENGWAAYLTLATAALPIQNA
jgi:hypothetical protein